MFVSISVGSEFVPCWYTAGLVFFWTVDMTSRSDDVRASIAERVFFIRRNDLKFELVAD